MADGNKSLSLMGAAPPSSHSIDQFHWDEAALKFAEFSVAEHESLVQMLGTGCASEVLLISIAKKCGTDKRKWQQARDLGIPLQGMRWTHLGGHMENYDARVTQTKGADSTPQVMRRPASNAQTSSKKVSRKEGAEEPQGSEDNLDREGAALRQEEL